MIPSTTKINPFLLPLIAVETFTIDKGEMLIVQGAVMNLILIFKNQ